MLLLLAVFGGMTASAVGIALMVFGSLSSSIRDLTDTSLPLVEDSFAFIEKSAITRDIVSQVAHSPDQKSLAHAHANLMTSIDALEIQAAALPEETAETIMPALPEIRKAVGWMRDALDERFEASQRMQAKIIGFSALLKETRARLSSIEDQAKQQIAESGQNTFDVINTTIASLTGREIEHIQALHDLRSNLNLAIGLAIATTGTEDAGFGLAIDAELAKAHANATAQLEELWKIPAYAKKLGPVETALSALNGPVVSENSAFPTSHDTLLELGQSGVTAIEDVIFTLNLGLAYLGEDVTRANETAIRQLLDEDVEHMRDAADIEQRVNALFIDALLGVAESSLPRIDQAQSTLNADLDALETQLTETGLDHELPDLLVRLSEIADPESGLLQARKDVIRGDMQAVAKLQTVDFRLVGISKTARAESIRAIEAIGSAGRDVLTETRAAQDWLYLVGVASLVIIFVVPILTWRFVLRPMRRVIRVTERLATGDLSEVTGFERVSGEIGSMASALQIFRDNMINRQEMEANKARREAALREAEARTAEEKRRQEAEIQNRRADLEETERQRSLAQARNEAEIARATQEERDARAREQANVIATLSNALQQLSEGDLSGSIQTEFSESYESLRASYNAAITSISDLIAQLVTSASIVNDSSQDISNTSVNMANSTEKNAAALMETSRAVADLDDAAKSARETAQSAEQIMLKARREADDTKTTVESAVESMAEIETSSNAISKIVDLIDDIAFQTNLLALNAGVEAARAGESGRGFAVVAAEVRGLAKRSSDAAGEINALISATRDQISNGAVQVNETGLAISGIMTVISQMSGHIDKIAEGARTQASAVSEIRDAMSHLDSSAQKNAAMFEESLAAGEVLRSNAAELLVLAQSFVTRPSETERSRPPQGEYAA